MRIRLDKLIKPELEELKENCNFTFAEMEVFNLLAKGISIKEISIALCISEAAVSRKIKRIKDKIERCDRYGRKENSRSYLAENKSNN